MSGASPKGLTVTDAKAFCMGCQKLRTAEGFKRIKPPGGSKHVKSQWRCAECVERKAKAKR